MSLPKALTTITPLSKTIAAFLFILLPFLAFFFGMQYQKSLTLSPSDISVESQTYPKKVWETFYSNQYEYSIHYPSEWSLIQHDKFTEDTVEYRAFTDPTLSKASQAPVFAIHIKTQSFSEARESIKKSLGVEQGERVTIGYSGGQEGGVKYTGALSTPGPQFVAYVIPFNERTFLVTTTPEQEGKDFTEVIERMLTTLTYIPPGYSNDRINVMFREGTYVDPPVAALPVELRDPVISITRPFTVPKPTLDYLRARGEARISELPERYPSIEKLPDLNLWFRITLKPSTNVVTFLGKLRLQENVEFAVPSLDDGGIRLR